MALYYQKNLVGQPIDFQNSTSGLGSVSEVLASKITIPPLFGCFCPILFAITFFLLFSRILSSILPLIRRNLNH